MSSLEMLSASGTAWETSSALSGALSLKHISQHHRAPGLLPPDSHVMVRPAAMEILEGKDLLFSVNQNHQMLPEQASSGCVAHCPGRDV